MRIGIDLGTTNSAVACGRMAVMQPVPNALWALLTPSALTISCTAALNSQAPRHSIDTAATLAALRDMLETNAPL